MLGRFASGIRRASGPVPVIADVRQTNTSLAMTTVKRISPMLAVADMQVPCQRGQA